MPSDAQIDANRRNAQLSTGPRTAEGKDRSRRNALRHGLRAASLVMAPGEAVAEFRSFASDLHRDLAPAGAVEEALAQRIAILAWRLERAARLEAELLTGESFLVAREAGLDAPATGALPPELSALARYEATLDRAFERSMRMLREHQKLRLAGALPECLDEITERTQFADDEDSAERTQFAAGEEFTERTQFGPADEAGAEEEREEEEEEEELLSPQEVIARREAARQERARLLNEACRPKGTPVPA
ncbi:MAG TPA: hypothetical protein VLV50_03255 [Stellaceae bacterium]|nr:hypothetical protein [Stellaceae bacterium]